jgi:hypothetical protein
VRNAYKTLVRKAEEKRPLEKPSHRHDDNIRKNLRGIGWEGVDWMHVYQYMDQ